MNTREPDPRISGQTAGRSAEPSQPHTRTDEAANVAGKDEVQIGSEASFPASDPPSWMNVARPGGREHGPEDHQRPHVPIEPPRQPPQRADDRADRQG